MKTRVGVLVGVMLALLTAACSSSVSRPGAGTDAIFVSTLPDVAAGTSVGLDQPDYRVGPLDVLEVSVFGVSELTKTVRVSSSGQIALPLIGTVAAAGKTAAELENEVAEKLGRTYLQSPQVSVAVKEAVGERITVSGSVKNPGVFPIMGRTTLLQSIAMAQGPDEVADPENVVIFRNQAGQRLAARFDLSAIHAGRASDPAIMAGDVIVVDQSGGRAALRDITKGLPLLSVFTPFLLL